MLAREHGLHLHHLVLTAFLLHRMLLARLAWLDYMGAILPVCHGLEASSATVSAFPLHFLSEVTVQNLNGGRDILEALLWSMPWHDSCTCVR